MAFENCPILRNLSPNLWVSFVFLHVNSLYASQIFWSLSLAYNEVHLYHKPTMSSRKKNFQLEKPCISVICGVGLFISAPFIFSALATAVSGGVIGAFILMFFGQVFLNMNWAIVVDISLVRIKALVNSVGKNWPKVENTKNKIYYRRKLRIDLC